MIPLAREANIDGDPDPEVMAGGEVKGHAAGLVGLVAAASGLRWWWYVGGETCGGRSRGGGTSRQGGEALEEDGMEAAAHLCISGPYFPPLEVDGDGGRWWVVVGGGWW